MIRYWTVIAHSTVCLSLKIHHFNGSFQTEQSIITNLSLASQICLSCNVKDVFFFLLLQITACYKQCSFAKWGSWVFFPFIKWEGGARGKGGEGGGDLHYFTVASDRQ